MAKKTRTVESLKIEGNFMIVTYSDGTEEIFALLSTTPLKRDAVSNSSSDEEDEEDEEGSEETEKGPSDGDFCESMRNTFSYVELRV